MHPAGFGPPACRRIVANVERAARRPRRGSARQLEVGGGRNPAAARGAASGQDERLRTARGDGAKAIAPQERRMHGQAHDDASHVREDDCRYRCCGRNRRHRHRAGRIQRQLHVDRRGQAHSFHVPRLRQDGMRRVGVRARRQGHPQRRRRGRLPVHGQPLLEGPGIAASRVPSGPPEVSHEAHEPEVQPQLGRRHQHLQDHRVGPAVLRRRDRRREVAHRRR